MFKHQKLHHLCFLPNIQVGVFRVDLPIGNYFPYRLVIAIPWKMAENIISDLEMKNLFPNLKTGHFIVVKRGGGIILPVFIVFDNEIVSSLTGYKHHVFLLHQFK